MTENSSTDSLGPDYTDSGKRNLRKSAKSVEDSKSLPNSRKVYVAGKLHPDLRVPFREISLAPTKTISGEIEVNEPVRVYDTSGPWGDPDVDVDVTRGLPALREKWIRDRRDVEEIDGRKIQPIDDGFLSIAHAEHSAKRNGNGQSGSDFSTAQLLNRSTAAQRKPLRASAGRCVTQLY